MHTSTPSHGLKDPDVHVLDRWMPAIQKHLACTIHKRNVATSMVGLKNGHICKNLTKGSEPLRYSWENIRRRRRINQKTTAERPVTINQAQQRQVQVWQGCIYRRDSWQAHLCNKRCPWQSRNSTAREFFHSSDGTSVSLPAQFEQEHACGEPGPNKTGSPAGLEFAEVQLQLPLSCSSSSSVFPARPLSFTIFGEIFVYVTVFIQPIIFCFHGFSNPFSFFSFLNSTLLCFHCFLLHQTIHSHFFHHPIQPGKLPKVRIYGYLYLGKQSYLCNNLASMMIPWVLAGEQRRSRRRQEIELEKK